MTELTEASSVNLEDIVDFFRQQSDIAEQTPLEERTAETKKDGSPVTKSDLEIQKNMSLKFRSFFPEAFILGEEEANNYSLEQVFSHDRILAFDPIDGTGDYSKGRSYALSAGLLEKKNGVYLPTFGIVALPKQNRIYVSSAAGFLVYAIHEGFVPQSEMETAGSILLTRINQVTNQNLPVNYQDCTVKNIVDSALNYALSTVSRSHIWDVAGAWGVFKDSLEVYNINNKASKDKTRIFGLTPEMFNENFKLTEYYVFVNSENAETVLKNVS